ncbi:pyruvate dehydrogenase complex dihydrolipoamide acetyltransferase [Sphingomonas jatrophae]|uniref:Acetyltransferase component of pyruvate dehydrogenase complex n=1 Tax=Sphingomonas jatrophae TaxID=1166337 RepID=A0A1I6LGI0_9SPHN|nr:pyruvate dehydrogenase complex dihydrolipoamide acetyltransferase [Sphingomonas jatrophae]SFS02420.1 pyruvate dehydrogenase E2 component (dihydrolipoamide acetyltransferase) [Sphingomonas jatrophae]
MPIEIKMPALSPTMEEGTLAKWLVKEGDPVKSGDILAEIETDKATMEYEAVDEGVVAKLVVAEGTEGVKVGELIALIAEQGEDAEAAAPAKTEAARPAPAADAEQKAEAPAEKGYGASPADDVVPDSAPAKAAAKPEAALPAKPAQAQADDGERLRASPLARRIAAQQGLDLASVTGSGPNGRIVKADVEGARAGTAAPAPAKAAEPAAPAAEAAPAPASAPAAGTSDIPHEEIKLSNVRKVIARRLTESKQQVPHIYLTVDCRLDALLKLRGQLNEALEPRGVKLSVNDILIKALALALLEVPSCNVSFAGDKLLKYSRADISVAVSLPAGLITPIIVDAGTKSLSAIATEMKTLAAKARDGKLQPHEYQGGTASISNMGMMGIKQFDAVINPPQAMILAVGAGEQRPYVIDGKLDMATVMTVTGSFDHRAIDGADGAQLLGAFKRMVEAPLAMLA